MSTMRTVLTFALSLRGSIVDQHKKKNKKKHTQQKRETIHNKQYKN